MENITLGWLNNNIAFVVTLVGGLWAVYKAIKKAFNSGLDPIVKQINSVESNLKSELVKIDMNHTKNFLVARINDIEQGQKLDEVSLERFWEEYEHYTKDLGGNSYIVKREKALQKKKKL